ncbi:MAG: hypothetical protein AAF899_06950 [Pseudomonadota bacterium]
MPVVPRNYDEWVKCITVDCGIPLTQDFVARRIDALQDESDYHTRKFIETWGAAHHAKTLEWFKEASARLSQ